MGCQGRGTNLGYLSTGQLEALELKYGKPVEVEHVQSITEAEMEILAGSKQSGRAHDFTVFIFNGQGEVAVIRKPSFPEGVYRAPSGGVGPGEDVETGIKREAWEETGLQIVLERYLLRVKVVFWSGCKSEVWTTHVFSARGEGSPVPVDSVEIAEARFITTEELGGTIRRRLLATGKPFFQYRVMLTDLAFHLLGLPES